MSTAAARLQALWVSRRRRRLTLFGRSVVLIGCELLANAACWLVTGILFGGREDAQQILGLALLAWVCCAVSPPFVENCTSMNLLLKTMFRPFKTIGLRHGEFMCHL
jgi:hypothetical protein